MYITPGIIPAFRNELSKCDVIHLHEFRSFQNIAFLISNRERRPYVVEPHGVKPPEAGLSEGKAILISARQAYGHTFGARLLRNAGWVIALNDSEKRALEIGGARPKGVVVMPNGVSPEDFCNSPGPHLFKSRVGINHEKVILYVGRVAKSKGIDTLLRAFSLLCKHRNDLRLVIAGADDGYLENLKIIAQEHDLGRKVVFAGLLTHEEKLSAYDCADVVVYPGIYEGFPIVPLEAAIMEKPVIVSNDLGMNYVTDGGFGLSFRYGSAEELSHTLELILSDDELAKSLGTKGKRCVMDNYTWEIISRKIESLYRALLTEV
jgi:glycosyltransferase involved in cell wall biosynthesis